MLSDLLILVMVGIRLAIALSLTRLGRRQGQRPLLWLALAFYANGLSNIFLTSELMPNLLLFALGLLISQPALVMFTRQTFYQGQPSPWRLFMAISVAGPLLSAGLVSTGGGFALLLPGAAGAFLNWSWHTWSAWRARRALAGDPYVEPWVKGRYACIVLYGLIMMLSVLLLPLRDMTVQVPVLSVLQVLVAIAALVLQYLAWCMPRWLRAYLNRGYAASPADDEPLLSEEELLPQGHCANTTANTTHA
jgi:hypothetical protein